jgi:hypothetical protein
VPNQADEQPLSVLRIYLRHRSRKPGPGFLGRIFLRSLSNDLAARALEAGVSYVRESLVESNREDLTDAVLLRIDGTKVSLRGVPA